MQDAITTIVCCAITVIVSVLIANKNAKTEIEKLKTEKELDRQEYLIKSSYDIKKSAILETLKFLDSYISWMKFDDSRIAIREKPNTDLTFIARDCYNNLSCTCDNAEILYLFNDIVFGDETIRLEKYNEFRNAVRKELGLEEVELDDQRVFISKVSTKELDEIKE